jgi:K+-transporting ATPase A subunit
MALPANEARGEIAVTVDGVDLVVAAEMERLAMLSSQIGCQSWTDMVSRISGAELSAIYAVLEICVVRGNVKAARKALTPRGAFALGGALTVAMTHWFDKDGEGKNAPSAGADD